MYLYMNSAIFFFYNDLHYLMPPNSSKMLCQTSKHMNPGLTGSSPPLDGNKWHLMAGHRSNRQIHDKPGAALHKPAVRRPLLVELAAQTCPPCLQLQTRTAPHLRTKRKEWISLSARALWIHHVLPTVSTSTMSYPAPSQRTMASLVVLVTPPSVPEAGDGLIKAFMSLESSVMRVLSPNREPAATQRRWVKLRFT